MSFYKTRVYAGFGPWTLVHVGPEKCRDIDVFQNCLIDVDIFKNYHIDIDIFQKCRYIDNRYLLSIYRTGLALGKKSLMLAANY